jgi:hypothetical protein
MQLVQILVVYLELYKLFHFVVDVEDVEVVEEVFV